jgi:oligogalacturonide lyase
MKPKLLPAGLLTGASPALAAHQPPTEWIDPSSGHRIIRLSRQPGSSSSCFTHNEFTLDGKWIVFRSNMYGTT